MRLTLKNIGKIKEADIMLDGITVITGHNDTGKSTIGKALYVMSNSLTSIDNQIRRWRIYNIKIIIYNFPDELPNVTDNKITSTISQILNHSEEYKNNPIKLYHILYGLVGNKDNTAYVGITAERISELLELTDLDVVNIILNNKINSEFGGYIGNMYSDEDVNIGLEVKGITTNVSIEDNCVNSIDNIDSLIEESIYIDNSNILELKRVTVNPDFSCHHNHKTALRNKILSKENIIDKTTTRIASKTSELIYSKINSVCNGDIVEEGVSGFKYKLKNTGEVFNIENLAPSLRPFLILKTLLQNKTIKYDSTIIWDDPEGNLHPEWQLLLAEVLVLVQKEFNAKILLNTHSPYFLRAIETYSAKYGISDRCKYYLTSLSDKNSIVKDVSDDIELIYREWATPFDTLELVRWGDDYCEGEIPTKSNVF